MATEYERLSKERKQLQAKAEVPDWMTTGGYQMFKSKYMYKGINVNDTFWRIAKCAAKHMGSCKQSWADDFYAILSRGWFGASTPVLANMGTNRGMPVSCSGQVVGDSIDEFYKSAHELAVLTKDGFGTSSYLGDIRSRGNSISVGGTASGVLDVITSYVEVMRKVKQGQARRGAWAGYLPIDHGDYYEVVNYLEHHQDDLNLGWVVTDEFIERLKAGDTDATRRLQRAMKVKAVTGKGYFFFVDKVNRASPQMYKDLDLSVKASNLCIEIALHSDPEHSFTCVLGSMNYAKYNEWKDTNAIQIATVFLDCVVSEFLEQAKGKSGFDKVVRATEKSRAIGLGALGLHTYLQQEGIPFESFEAHMLNNRIFKELHDETLKASQFLADELGEPEWCKGHGVRNTHRTAIAPTTTNALICGGVSQGIEPVVANLYNQQTSAGVLYRVNPVFLALAKERGEFTDELVKDLAEETGGSVQHLDWLTDHEKEVFKTAYEIDQKAIIRMAAARQPHICQSQSLNLFFDADEDEEYIMEVHQEAFLNENILGLYYMRTKAGVQASKGDCKACE
ncbi:MAG: putative ribonucleoside-diphosphate reductase subunit alpha [Prokaryotic dsDNA virus sp.]|nr:MAG: putative ribonucleoside-diphosphate reductase subunit alpha [Prokaryotic dsDNA virus sp.]|tara:strand:- start:23641 stop:25335 length:1695 start_codon:yes stop_codon:yes gene_type:complete